MRGVLDVAGFAVNAIGGVDAEHWLAGFLGDFIDAGGAIKGGRFAVGGKIVADRNCGIGQHEVDGLVFIVGDVGKVDR